MLACARCLALLLCATIAAALLYGCDGDSSSTADTTDQRTDSTGAPMPGSGTGGGSSGANKPQSTGFNGPFHANVNGTQSILQLRDSGGKITGTLESAPITARAQGQSAKGELTDPESGKVAGSLDFSLNGDKLTMVLVLKDPDSGETLAIPPVTYTRGEPPPIHVQNDPALVGRWRYTWTAASGGASMAVDAWLFIEADGTFREGPSKAAGGDANVGMESSSEGGGFRGKWRTENRTLYVMEQGSTQWVPLARYYVEGDKMMFTYDNGSKRIYERP